MRLASSESHVNQERERRIISFLANAIGGQMDAKRRLAKRSDGQRRPIVCSLLAR